MGTVGDKGFPRKSPFVDIPITWINKYVRVFFGRPPMYGTPHVNPCHALIPCSREASISIINMSLLTTLDWAAPDSALLPGSCLV